MVLLGASWDAFYFGITRREVRVYEIVLGVGPKSALQCHSSYLQRRATCRKLDFWGCEKMSTLPCQMLVKTEWPHVSESRELHVN
jgi:hypothetical protein